ncbi:hypothetical protein EMIT0111MI5_30008 [Burkholderia sp. IT-111MI5]
MIKRASQESEPAWRFSIGILRFAQSTSEKIPRNFRVIPISPHTSLFPLFGFLPALPTSKFIDIKPFDA